MYIYIDRKYFLPSSRLAERCKQTTARAAGIVAISLDNQVDKTKAIFVTRSLDSNCVACNFDAVPETPVHHVENVVFKPAAKPLLLKPGQVVVVLAIVLEASLLSKNERLLLHFANGSATLDREIDV